MILLTTRGEKGRGKGFRKNIYKKNNEWKDKVKIGTSGLRSTVKVWVDMQKGRSRC
jgi:hypothetical protein